MFALPYFVGTSVTLALSNYFKFLLAPAEAKNNIQDTELLLQFEKVEKLNDSKKSLVKEFLDAFILKSTLQQQLS